MRIKATLSYDGSRYYGFQIQKKEKEISIQGELNKVLNQIFNNSIKIYGAGRTDKGVHALGQVFHFDISFDNYDLDKLRYSMNMMLPKDINIISLEKVNEDFHARYSARKKWYQYRVSLKDNPFFIRYALIYHYKLNLDLMEKGLNIFLGKHNFVNFCSIREFDTNFEETIYSFHLKQENDMLIFDIVGSGFKRYMVRQIIATILMLGREKINLDYIIDHLKEGYIDSVPYKVDPQGLYLMEVFYD